MDPNIDHLIFRQFKNPSIFGHKRDMNLDEVVQETYRPFYPKLQPEIHLGVEETKAIVDP